MLGNSVAQKKPYMMTAETNWFRESVISGDSRDKSNIFRDFPNFCPVMEQKGPGNKYFPVTLYYFDLCLHFWAQLKSGLEFSNNNYTIRKLRDRSLFI